MTRQRSFFLFLSLILVGAAAAADPWTPGQTTRQATRKQRVLVAGRIERAINFDFFVLSGEDGRLLLNAAGVRQRLAAGDTVVVWGRYLGRTLRFDNDLSEVEALDLAAAGSPEAAKLIAAHPMPAASVTAGASPAAAPSPAAEPAPLPPGAPAPHASVEDRLRTLEELKAKGLVTDDEYRAQRQRILGDL